MREALGSIPNVSSAEAMCMCGVLECVVYVRVCGVVVWWCGRAVVLWCVRLCVVVCVVCWCVAPRLPGHF